MTKRKDRKDAAEKFRARKVWERRRENRRGGKGKISQESSRRDVGIKIMRAAERRDLDRQ